MDVYSIEDFFNQLKIRYTNLILVQNEIEGKWLWSYKVYDVENTPVTSLIFILQNPNRRIKGKSWCGVERNCVCKY